MLSDPRSLATNSPGDRALVRIADGGKLCRTPPRPRHSVSAVGLSACRSTHTLAIPRTSTAPLGWPGCSPPVGSSPPSPAGSAAPSSCDRCAPTASPSTPLGSAGGSPVASRSAIATSPPTSPRSANPRAPCSPPTGCCCGRPANRCPARPSPAPPSRTSTSCSCWWRGATPPAATGYGSPPTWGFYERVYVHAATWTTVCNQLIDELTRSSGVAFLRRYEAAVALLANPQSRRHVTRSVGRFVMHPDAQNVAPALGLLREVADEAAGELVLRLMRGDNGLLRRGAIGVAGAWRRRARSATTRWTCSSDTSATSCARRATSPGAPMPSSWPASCPNPPSPGPWRDRRPRRAATRRAEPRDDGAGRWWAGPDHRRGRRGVRRGRDHPGRPRSRPDAPPTRPRRALPRPAGPAPPRRRTARA